MSFIWIVWSTLYVYLCPKHKTPQPIILKLGPINPGDDDYYTHYYQFSQMVDEDGWNPPTFQATKMIYKSYIRGITVTYNCRIQTAKVCH